MHANALGEDEDIDDVDDEEGDPEEGDRDLENTPPQPPAVVYMVDRRGNGQEVLPPVPGVSDGDEGDEQDDEEEEEEEVRGGGLERRRGGGIEDDEEEEEEGEEDEDDDGDDGEGEHVGGARRWDGHGELGCSVSMAFICSVVVSYRVWFLVGRVFLLFVVCSKEVCVYVCLSLNQGGALAREDTTICERHFWNCPGNTEHREKRRCWVVK